MYGNKNWINNKQTQIYILTIEYSGKSKHDVKESGQLSLKLESRIQDRLA